MGRRVIEISDTALTLFFDGRECRFKVVEGALPADTKIVNAQMEFIANGYQTLHLLLESAEWDGPKEGDRYPPLDMRFQTLDT